MTDEAKKARYEYLKEWRSKNKDKLRAQNERYRKAHPEVGRKARKRYYAAHREKCIEYAKQYRRDHPDQYRASIEKHWEKKAGEAVAGGD